MTYNGNASRTVLDSINRDVNGLFICPFCQEHFKGLAYHTIQVHKISGRELRQMYHLPFNYPLQTEDIIENRRQKALYYEMDKRLIKTGKKTRFKKGRKLTKQEIEILSKGHMKEVNYK